MNFIQTSALWFSTAVSALYLISGGYKTIKGYVEKKIDAAAKAKIAGSSSDETK